MIAASTALVLSILPSIILAGVPDAEADKAVGKHTLAVRLGIKRAVSLAMALTILSTLSALVASGSGIHPATQALVALRRDTRIRARWLYQQIIRGVEELGATIEPALFDILFGAPAAPLTRLAVALRAGRTMTGERGAPVHWLPEPWL